jgi:hypothetical protein
VRGKQTMDTTTIDKDLVETAISELPSFLVKDNASVDVLVYASEPTNIAVIVRRLVKTINTAEITDEYYLHYKNKVNENQFELMCIQIEKDGLVNWVEKNPGILHIVSTDFFEIIARLKEEISQ